MSQITETDDLVEITNDSVSPLVVSAKEAAKMLSVSERHFWAQNSRGRIPRPVRIGRSVRWRVDELKAWVAAGMPERSRWEAMRDNHGFVAT